MLRIIFSLLVLTIVGFTTLYTSSPLVAFPPHSPGEITFVGNAGSDNVFTVEQWKFTQLDNLETPEKIRVTAVLDMTSITCDWKDLQKNLHKKKEYFHSKKFNTAQIDVEGAEAQADGSYLAAAEVSMKGVTRTVPLRFTLTGTGPYELAATATIERRSFNFSGNGPKEEVPVSVTATINQ